MRSGDTIVAVATPPGRGGIGIVRISGVCVPDLARAIVGRLPAPRQATLAVFRGLDGEPIDRGIVLYFPGPASYTGEDVLELQGHGSPIVLDMLLERLTQQGARLARPGEFSERAFLNDRLDLAQAEAVADLIDSASREAARAALRSLDGAFSRRISALTEGVAHVRVQVEAGIDFSDEDIDPLGKAEIVGRLRDLGDDLKAIMAEARRGHALREGLRVVIAGPPNAGKSSLLNRLARRETAIVSPVPGTTRDVLHEEIVLGGVPIHLVDTAGLREADDPLERMGIERAREELVRADRIVVVIDESEAAGGLPENLPAEAPLTLIYNKCDLTGGTPSMWQDEADVVHIRLSVRTGAGMELLEAHLQAAAGLAGPEAAGFSARRRHLDALRRAADLLAEAISHLAHGAEDLGAEAVRLAQKALGEITGEVTTEDLLGRIFSAFCIGK